MIFWIWLAAILTAMVLYLRKAYSRFSRYGVKYSTPLPFIGNIAPIVLGMVNHAESTRRVYNAFPEERFVGRYYFTSPMILIRDIELVKKITVKDYEHFLDHTISIDHIPDSLTGQFLFVMKGQDWKDMRSTLSPAFTAAKIRLMVPFMVEVAERMMMALHKEIQESKDGYIDVDAMDLTYRFTTDVIASSIFGLKVNSSIDGQNEFYSRVKPLITPTYKSLLLLFGYMQFPKIMTYFKVESPPMETQDFFMKLVTNTMRMREERNIVRPDMIQLLMEVKKHNLLHADIAGRIADDDVGFATAEESAVGRKRHNREWSENMLIIQAMSFFFAGFDSVSIMMAFLIHELAMNPDVQEKLVQEIKETDVRNKGELNFNSIQQMEYLDMVVSEVLRKWFSLANDRVCTRDYNLGKPNDACSEDYIIRKGEGVIIPMWAFHHDPQYFPNPDKFDPERFSDQNKHNIKPYTYMPFGLGPRNCIGSRFALCMLKVMAYQLLRIMEVSPSAKTQIPVKLSKDPFLRKIQGGHWVRLKARN